MSSLSIHSYRCAEPWKYTTYLLPFCRTRPQNSTRPTIFSAARSPPLLSLPPPCAQTPSLTAPPTVMWCHDDTPSCLRYRPSSQPPPRPGMAAELHSQDFLCPSAPRSHHGPIQPLNPSFAAHMPWSQLGSGVPHSSHAYLLLASPAYPVQTVPDSSSHSVPSDYHSASRPPPSPPLLE